MIHELAVTALSVVSLLGHRRWKPWPMRISISIRVHRPLHLLEKNLLLLFCALIFLVSIFSLRIQSAHVLRIVEIKQLTVFRHPRLSYINIPLIRNGAIGCAPHGPNLCFTLRTFEDYRQCHRFNPRMTIQSQVRKFCALHNVCISFIVYT